MPITVKDGNGDPVEVATMDELIAIVANAGNQVAQTAQLVLAVAALQSTDPVHTIPDSLPALPAGTNTIGGITPVPRATGNGATVSRVNSGASNNLTSLKASAGNIVGIDVFNVAAYDVFLKLYNKASAPVVASDTPVWTIPIKAGTGFSREFTFGRSFATGIAYAIVKLQADTDNTNVAAGDLTGSIAWI